MTSLDRAITRLLRRHRLRIWRRGLQPWLLGAIWCSALLLAVAALASQSRPSLFSWSLAALIPGGLLLALGLRRTRPTRHQAAYGADRALAARGLLLAAWDLTQIGNHQDSRDQLILAAAAKHLPDWRRKAAEAIQQDPVWPLYLGLIACLLGPMAGWLRADPASTPPGPSAAAPALLAQALRSGTPSSAPSSGAPDTDDRPALTTHPASRGAAPSSGEMPRANEVSSTTANELSQGIPMSAKSTEPTHAAIGQTAAGRARPNQTQVAQNRAGLGAADPRAPVESDSATTNPVEWRKLERRGHSEQTADDRSGGTRLRTLGQAVKAVQADETRLAAIPAAKMPTDWSAGPRPPKHLGAYLARYQRLMKAASDSDP